MKTGYPARFENVTGTVFDDKDLWLQNTLFYIRMCFVPIIIGGTFTNGLTFFVLLQKEMTSISTCVYLLVISVADLGVMYVELFRVWFEWMDFINPSFYITDTYCKLANFFTGVVRDFSNWLIACVTFERLLMVRHPFKAKRICDVKKAKIVTVTLLGLICLPHINCLVFSKAQRHNKYVCWEDPDSRVGQILSAMVEFCVGYTVVIVVFVLNMILATSFYRSNSKAWTVLQRRARAVSNKRLTKTMLMIGILFLVCETPRTIVSFIGKFCERTPTRRIILNLSFVLSGINHASNLFIYIVSSPRFRTLLMESIRKSDKGKYIVKHIPTHVKEDGPDLMFFEKLDSPVDIQAL